MNTKTLQRETRDLISNNRLIAALDLLKEHLKEGGEADDSRIRISRRLHDTRGMTDLEERRTLNLENNKSTDSLIALINKLQDSDLSKTAKTSAWNPGVHILAFAPNDATKNDLHDYFASMKIPKDNFDIRIFGDHSADMTKHKLVIFDNRDLIACPREDMLERLPAEVQKTIQKRINTMNEIMSVRPYAIHFGEFLYWVNNNRDFVNAANSRFTLFARICQMLDYLKATGKYE